MNPSKKTSTIESIIANYPEETFELWNTYHELYGP